MAHAGGPTTLGERLARLRGRRLTQRALAEAAEVSIDVIRKLEQGQRHTATIPTLQRIARALDVDISALLTDPPKRLESPSEHAGVLATRHVLTDVADLFGMEDDDQADLMSVRSAATYAWGAYRGGRYEHLSTVLPVEIARARIAAHAAGPDEAPEAAVLAARLLQVASCTMAHWDQPDAAHIAIREAMRWAEAGPDPLLPVALRHSMAWLLLNQGRYADAHRLASTATAGIQPGGGSPLPQWTLYGSGLITAATSAARHGNRDEGLSLLAEAEEVAAHTGARNDYETGFGPDQVLMQIVDVNVVTEHYGSALTAAQRMPRDTVLPPGTRARHLSDVAVSQVRTGRVRRAEDTVWAMEALAPEWMRFQAHPRGIVRELRERSVSPRLRELSERIGLGAA